MFDIGFAEILLLSLVGLLVLGPEKLQRLARSMGKMTRKARASWVSLKRTIEAELEAEELKKPIQSFKEEVKATVDEVKAGVDMSDTVDELKATAKEFESTVDELKPLGPQGTTTSESKDEPSNGKRNESG